MPLGCKFSEYIYILVVWKKTVKTNDILVFEAIMYSDFFSNLILNFLLFDDFFIYYLHRTNEIAHFMSKSTSYYLTIQTTPNFPLPNSFNF